MIIVIESDNLKCGIMQRIVRSHSIAELNEMPHFNCLELNYEIYSTSLNHPWC
jgi:hypothetical protein